VQDAVNNLETVPLRPQRFSYTRPTGYSIPSGLGAIGSDNRYYVTQVRVDALRLPYIGQTADIYTISGINLYDIKFVNFVGNTVNNTHSNIPA